MSQLQHLIQLVSQSGHPQTWHKFPLVVAVSGGPDSVALLRLLHATWEKHGTAVAPIIVAHVNHGLRGEESDTDERFVRRLAQSLDLEIHVSKLQHEKPTNEQSKEQSHQGGESKPAELVSELSLSEANLRDCRYRTLIEIAKKTDSRYIATGHTRDDQIETILFRIFRGTGINGLTGIPNLRVVDEAVSIVRPLLAATKQEVLNALREIGQEFRHDASNSESIFTRNFLRNEILPQIRERFGAVDESISRLGIQASEIQEFLDSEAAKLGAAIVSQSPQAVELDCRVLADVSQVLVRQFLIQIWNQQQWPLQSMTFQWWREVGEALQDLESQSILNLPDSIRMEKTGHQASFIDQTNWRLRDLVCSANERNHQRKHKKREDR